MPKGKRLITVGERVIQTPHANIHGFQQCCSAAILHGISGYSVAACLPEEAPYSIQNMDPAHCATIAEYIKRRSKKHTIFGLPKEYAYAAVLEELYNKAEHGEGGHNMYASQTYATKTWFMADRRRTPGSFCCLNFMKWLKEQGPGTVGRIHISPWRDGAHGGQCKGAVYSPDLPKIREFLDEKIDELNAHADYVFWHYGLNEDNMGDNMHTGDEVGKLW